MSDPPPRQPRTHWTLRRGVSAAVTGGVLVALAAVALAVYAIRGSGAPSPYPDSITAVVPAPGSQAPRQAPVGVRLRPGWQPDITIDGVAIPDTQLTAGIRELGEFFFAPRPGRVIEEIRPGRTCAAVVARPLVDVDSADVLFEWCFTSV
ncbi:MAG TPA: hypothetical protein DEP69_05275 [Acidimicrobiaceae bacterium]|nr:hypothetical protein [Acidimicrobiaceae bacterium]